MNPAFISEVGNNNFSFLLNTDSVKAGLGWLVAHYCVLLLVCTVLYNSVQVYISVHKHC